MGETGSSEDDDFDLLVGNIKQQLQATNPSMEPLEWSSELIDELAESIATNIHYAFEYRLMDRWRPRPLQT
jgi:hypothetical protein